MANLNSQISKKKQAQNQQQQEADIVQSQVIVLKLNLKLFSLKYSLNSNRYNTHIHIVEILFIENRELSHTPASDKKIYRISRKASSSHLLQTAIAKRKVCWYTCVWDLPQFITSWE